MAILMGCWDCDSCEVKGVRGDAQDCSGCGAGRPEDVSTVRSPPPSYRGSFPGRGSTPPPNKTVEAKKVRKRYAEFSWGSQLKYGGTIAGVTALVVLLVWVVVNLLVAQEIKLPEVK